jgi:hypothetical protein
VLVAIDAPLGWPGELGQSLALHKAGGPIDRAANSMFRRETDRFIRRRIGKQSLDVGADRIARTAFAALAILNECRRRTGLGIPLAWSPNFDGVTAIEVYPAATLRAHAIPDRGYKAKGGTTERSGILRRLAAHCQISVGSEDLMSKVDVLDAAICVLAGIDFIDGHSMPPLEPDLAIQEGWIWARDPLDHCPCVPQGS